MGILDNFTRLVQPRTLPRTSVGAGSAAVAKGDGRQAPIVLQQGQFIRGEVIDLRSKEVTVRLADGRQLTAKLSDSSALYIGLRADFYVQEAGDALITLKLLADGDTDFSEATIDKALEGAGLPKTEHTVSVVRALLSEHMPVGRESIRQLLYLASQHKDASLSTLALLLKHNLPVTEQTLTQLEHFRNYEHRLTGQLQSLAAELEALFSEPAATKTPSVTVLHKEVLSLLAPKEALPVQTADTHPLLLSEAECRVLAKELQSLLPLSTAQQTAKTAEEPLSRLLDILLKPQPDGAQKSDLFFSGVAALVQSLPQAETVLFQSSVYPSLLARAFTKQLVLTPEELQQPDAVADLYERMEQTLSLLKHSLEGAKEDAALKPAAATVSNMQDNLQFMNTLNALFPYVQLPLQLTEQLTHGELYVYTKKRELAKDSSSITVLLHLDMERLGPVDIHLALTGRQVAAKFYLNEELSKQVTANAMPSLTDALQKKGYSLAFEILTRESAPDPAKEFLAEGEAPFMKRYTFDIRA